MGVQACTISSRAYLANARVLARSFREHHPDGTLWALLVDDLDHEVDEVAEDFRVIRPEELGLGRGELHRMLMFHGGDFIAAVKPWLFEHLLRAGTSSLLYLDGDMQVFSSLDDIAELAANHTVVLTPHVLSPMPRDGLLPDEDVILGAGMFNAGFFGIGPGSGPFISFLQDRLRRECVVNIPGMRLNEQRWLDFAPSTLDAHILRDPGANVAYWNAHERDLVVEGDRISAHGQPLRFFHFSGFDLMRPEAFTRYTADRPRVTRFNHPVVAWLHDQYRARVMDAGYEQWRGSPMWFDQCADGTPIDGTLRQLYRRDLLVAEGQHAEGPPDPYEDAEIGAFREWARGSYQRAGVALPGWLVPTTVADPTPFDGDLAAQVRTLAQAMSQALTLLGTRMDQLESRLPQA